MNPFDLFLQMQFISNGPKMDFGTSCNKKHGDNPKKKLGLLCNCSWIFVNERGRVESEI
jgi:hypothetical protein